LPTFLRHAECAAGGCNLKDIVPDAVRPSADDKSPVWVWEQGIPKATILLLPRHAGVDVYGVLLAGEVSVTADDIKEKQKRVWPWGAFRAPGAGVNIVAKEPTRLLMVMVAVTAGSTAAQAIDAIASKPASVGWTKRAAPVSNVELPLKPDLSWGKGAYHARLGFEAVGGGETPSAAVGVLLLSRNAPVAEHVHDKEWEVLAVLQGDGELARKGGGDAGDTKTRSGGASSGNVKVGPGSIVAVPPGVRHAWTPSGKEPLLGIQIYSPPGPEQRFKKLAESAK
jgi:mannose-6-phosphate isomerase-like protein (cupin superfamily)